MQTDRELLELAAKAVGVGAPDNIGRDGTWRWFNSTVDGYGATWNPLRNDGDALRLMHVVYKKLAAAKPDGWIRIYDNLWGGSLADTRRAIVRAAAELGALL